MRPVPVVVIAWFAILITGNYPRLAFTFIEGLLRWGARVAAYAFLLTTDRYPPFRFSPWGNCKPEPPDRTASPAERFQLPPA